MTATAPPAVAGGNYYAEGVYCQTDVRRGVTTTRGGARILCLTADFLTGFRRAIADECGPAADTVFKSVGRKWGGFLAKRFEADMTTHAGRPLAEFTMAEFQANLADLFAHHGWGTVRLDLSRHDRGLVEITAESPVFAALSGPSDTPVESLMAGTFAGFFSAVFDQDLDCVQTACVAKGAPAARFVVGLTPRLAAAEGWVSAGKTHDQVVAELDAIRL